MARAPESASTLLIELTNSSDEEHRAYAGFITDMVDTHPEALRSVIEFQITQASVDQAFLTEAVPVLRELGRNDEYRHQAVKLLAIVADRAAGPTTQDAETAIRGILRNNVPRNS